MELAKALFGSASPSPNSSKEPFLLRKGAEVEGVEDENADSREKEPLVVSLPVTPHADDDEILLFEEIFARCEEWIMTTWNIDLKIIKIYRNPFLKKHHILQRANTSGTRALSRFQTALDHNGLCLAGLDYEFGWHGTEEHNMEAICRDGFNPMYRRGQQYGKGEYFGVTATASYGYCKGGSFLIATLIAMGTWVTPTNAVNAYLVNNAEGPTGITYCLPLAIVNFGAPKEAPFPKEVFPVEHKSVHAVESVGGDGGANEPAMRYSLP